jgi:mono/diheme cytochrome c family protein
MTQKNIPPKRSSSLLPIYLVLIFAVILVAVFAIQFAQLSAPEGGAELVLTPSSASYMEFVTPLLASANPARGADLLRTHGCVACHIAGANNNLAPSFEGLGTRAALTRPPLTAAAYIYESIVHPSAYEVEGYSSQMPRLYGTQISARDLGDLIAYLLTQ